MSEGREPTIEDKYRHLFQSAVGREVLADILKECHFGAILKVDSPAAIAEYNVGLLVLKKSGMLLDVMETMLGLRPKAH